MAILLIQKWGKIRINKNAFDPIIAKVSQKHNVDSSLIKAIIDQESSFKSNAVGGVGEIGLMQLQMIVVKEWAINHKIPIPSRGLVFLPELNIEIGTWYYAKALKRCKKYKYAEEMALCEYNAGRKRTREWKGWPPKNLEAEVINLIGIASTKKYVISIMKKYFKYASEAKNVQN